MQFTKKFCALIASLSVAASAQVVTQTPVPPPASAPATDDNRLREALRNTLGTDGNQPAPAIPNAPITAPPVNPYVSQPKLSTPMTVPAPATYWSRPPIGTNVTTVQLSLDEAIRLALENDLRIQVERYTPIIAGYDSRALYGHYDPVFSSAIATSHTTREGGSFNQSSGNVVPGSSQDIDGVSAGLSGYLPTGLKYDIGQNLNNVDSTTSQFTGTSNSFGQPIFRKVNSDVWNSVGTVSGYGVSLSQPLLRDFWIDADRLAIKLSKRDVRISESDFERILMEEINKVEQAYYRLIADRELVRVGESDVAVKKQFYEENRRRVEVGTLAPLDEKLAQAELAKSEVTLIVARKNALDSEAVLKGLIHDNFVSQINTHIELTDRLLALPERLELTEAFNEAIVKRPDLQSERMRLEKAQIQLKYDHNQLFPTLNVGASFGLNGLDAHAGGALDDIVNRQSPQISYGLSLTFPLSMWKERNLYKASKNAKSRQILALKQLEETVIQEVDFQIRLLSTTWQTVPLRREQTAYEQAALTAEQQKLAAGKSTSFNVLKIASDLALAQSDEIGTLRDYNQAVSELSFRKGTTLERWRINRPTRPNR